jgi:D-alanine transaminase
LRQVLVNGLLLPEAEAKISVFDRGFLFADAVYEVTAVFGGRILDFFAHIERLRRSLAAIQIPLEYSNDRWLDLHRQVIAANHLDEGLVYLQVSRGVSDRDFLLPDPPVPPTVVLFTQTRVLHASALAQRGLRIATFPDLRWQRNDIKSVQLLYASLVKTQAHRQGCDDAWLFHEDCITEGASSNAFILSAAGVLCTRHLSGEILGGITRQAVLSFAAGQGLTVEERPFRREEVHAAQEAFQTSATGWVSPVVQIDGHPIGTGVPGPVTLQLREYYWQTMLRHAV